MKLLLCVVLMVVISGICTGQTASPQEQTQQAILSELRAIHADMRAETSRTQNMELLLAELQVQAATVTRAVERVDAARSKTTDIQEIMRRVTTDISKDEEARESSSAEVDKSKLASDIERLKNDISSLKRVEQDRLANQQEAEASLQKAQNTYDVIEDQLSALMKMLRSAQDDGNR